MGSEHRQLVIIDQLKLNPQNDNWCTECTYKIDEGIAPELEKRSKFGICVSKESYPLS